jgi:hypothetical protein
MSLEHLDKKLKNYGFQSRQSTLWFAQDILSPRFMEQCGLHMSDLRGPDTAASISLQPVAMHNPKEREKQTKSVHQTATAQFQFVPDSLYSAAREQLVRRNRNRAF